jgi:hypothetical protein
MESSTNARSQDDAAMTRASRRWRIVVQQRLWLVAALVYGAAVFFGSQTSRAQAPPPHPPGYVGSDTCLACHDDKAQTLKGTPHAQAKNPRSPEATQGCESCHGPGQAHVDDDAKGTSGSSGRSSPAKSTRPASRVTTGGSTQGGRAARTSGGICPARPATACTVRRRLPTSW